MSKLPVLSGLKRIVTKPKLTKKQAEKLADEVSLSLAKKYEKLCKGDEKPFRETC